MRAASLIAPLAALAALGACQRHLAARAPASAVVAIPHAGPAQPASGLWTQRVADGQGVGVTRYCLDAAAAVRLADFGRQLAGRCRRDLMAEAANGDWRFATVCGGGAGKVATQGVAHGDFARGYVVEATAVGAGVVRRLRADVTWQGACPANMRPGDTVLADGQRLRLTDLAAPS
ncbi:MAG TPA: DUF3617 family protein [Caulobacteraceae bacterium]|nr:DUF3617 family protein [Caulobacteraceae bacterium]